MESVGLLFLAVVGVVCTAVIALMVITVLIAVSSNKNSAQQRQIADLKRELEEMKKQAEPQS